MRLAAHESDVVGEPFSSDATRQTVEIIGTSSAKTRSSSLNFSLHNLGDLDRLDLGLIAMSETVTTLHLYAGRKDALELRGRPTMQRALPIFGTAAV